jgi:hypothetical protein
MVLFDRSIVEKSRKSLKLPIDLSSQFLSFFGPGNALSAYNFRPTSRKARSTFLLEPNNMKKHMLLMPKAGVGFPLIMTLVAVCQAAAQSENLTQARRAGVTPIVFQAAGPTAESIQSMVDAFRAELGDPNNANNPGPLPSGRREINWDGGGANDTTDTPVTPFTVFLNTRGARFATLGTGLSQAPPEGGPQGGLAELLDNATYGDIFDTFSAPRLFTPVGSNITEGTFFVPGSNGGARARVTGFGAVFTDVDRQDGGDKHRGNRGASYGHRVFRRQWPATFQGGCSGLSRRRQPLILRNRVRRCADRASPDHDWQRSTRAE